MSNKLCPAAAKTCHLTSWWRRSFFTSSALSPHLNSSQTISPVCKNDSLWCFIIIIVIKSPPSSSSSSFSFTFYVFLLRLDRLAPPAGNRLEWHCIPNQIMGQMVPLVPPWGLKLESQWDWLDRWAEQVQGSHPAGRVAAVRAVGQVVGTTVHVRGAASLTASPWERARDQARYRGCCVTLHMTPLYLTLSQLRVGEISKTVQRTETEPDTFFCWQGGAGSLVTGAELETPHVTNHRCGIERLLQRTGRTDNRTLITVESHRNSEWDLHKAVYTSTTTHCVNNTPEVWLSPSTCF